MAKGHAVECDVCGDIEFYTPDSLHRLNLTAEGWIQFVSASKREDGSYGEMIDICSPECAQDLIKNGFEEEKPEPITVTLKEYGWVNPHTITGITTTTDGTKYYTT